MRYFLFILIMGVIAACAQKKDELPPPPIPEADFIGILADIHLAEAQLTEYADRKTRDSLSTLFFLQIAQIHGVELNDIQTSMQYYFSDAERLRNIYLQVEEQLNQLVKTAPESNIPDRPTIDERTPEEIQRAEAERLKQHHR